MTATEGEKPQLLIGTDGELYTPCSSHSGHLCNRDYCRTEHIRLGFMWDGQCNASADGITFDATGLPCENPRRPKPAPVKQEDDS